MCVIPPWKGDGKGREKEKATAVKYQSKYWRKASVDWEMHKLPLQVLLLCKMKQCKGCCARENDTLVSVKK